MHIVEVPVFCHFYPRPPRGGRLEDLDRRVAALEAFLPTPSARRATSTGGIAVQKPPDFYPRPPRGGRHHPRGRRRRQCAISTHALREEGDCTAPLTRSNTPISTHALREEGDFGDNTQTIRFGISTHALREEGDVGKMLRVAGVIISTHALREEGDW